MPICHNTVKCVSRRQGRSAVGAAAYRSGEKLYNDFDGKTSDFTRKKGIVHTRIILPENAPPEFRNRETLWNAVEQAEKRVDSRTAREVEIALPRELSLTEQIELVREYANEAFAKQGICVDVAIHAGRNSDNPHAHMLLTTRTVNREGFSLKKNRNWDKRGNVKVWREQWAELCNRALACNGVAARIDHRSYAEQGIEREPTKHLGHSTSALERRGIHTDRSNANREILARNREREQQARERQQERERSRIRNRGRELSR